MSRRLEVFSPDHFPLVGPGDGLAQLIMDSMQKEHISLENGDVLVLAQKIVSKSENRYVDLCKVEPSARARDLASICDKDPRLVQLILDESVAVLRCVPGVIVVRHRLGLVMANAGIDQSNIGNGAGVQRVLLLPRDPDSSAKILLGELERETGLQLAVIVSDSFGRPWRLGTTGFYRLAAWLE